MNSKDRSLLMGAGLCAALMTWALVFASPLGGQTALSVDGIVESTMGGFMFPDGTLQNSASAPGTTADSGQQTCWSETGTAIPCSGTGQDGELQKGMAWPAPRFADNGDGTVTDNLTGLIWLKEANCPSGAIDWQAALDWVTLLNTTSIACTEYAPMTFTDWRLPHIRELLSLVDYSESNPALPPTWTDWFFNVQSSVYWSSTTVLANPSAAWDVDFDNGNDQSNDKDTISNFVWPVRGGL